MQTHTQKVKMARRMTGGRLAVMDLDGAGNPKRDEDGKIVMNRVYPFSSAAWDLRKKARAARVARKQGAAHRRAVLRKSLKKNGKVS